MCSALPTTLLPNAGCVMDTWSTCPCRRPIPERPTDVSVPSDIGAKHGCLEISNIEIQLATNSRTWRLVKRHLGMTDLDHSRHFGCPPVTSGLPRWADILGVRRDVQNGPIPLKKA